MANQAILGNYEFELSGGVLCLDFANTGPDQKAPETGVEKLNSYADLLSWAVQSGDITSPDARRLLNAANHSPSKAKAALRKACELRQAIYNTFAAIATDSAPKTEDLDILNKYWKASASHRSVSPLNGSFQQIWTSDPADELDRPLWPIAASAAELMTGEQLGHVRQCASEKCSWLFLDQSRNRSRRWCDMKVCGNRAKAKRHYEKSRD